jgi:hypothetical protein
MQERSQYEATKRDRQRRHDFVQCRRALTHAVSQEFKFTFKFAYVSTAEMSKRFAPTDATSMPDEESEVNKNVG